MRKKKIAVIFGGKSTEYAVSLQSAFAVLCNIDREQYEVIPVGISRDGNWYHYKGEYQNISHDTWQGNPENLVPVSVSVSRSGRGLLELYRDSWRVMEIDFAFPVLHGRNGEDGRVQGIFEMAGIPIIGCNTLASALCMDKDRAHRLVHEAGIAVPTAITFRCPAGAQEEKQGCLQKYLAGEKKRLQEYLDQTAFPLFVKPIHAGSSYGITKVYTKEELKDAMETAVQYDGEIIIEESIAGFEVGCAIMGTEDLTVGRVDEIELSSGFFDYEEKYTLKTSHIFMPARIDRAAEKRIQKTAMRIYRILGCSGFARVDMFLTPAGELVFNEVNTIPGFTAHSRFPNMMQGIGLSFEELLERLIHMASE